MLAARFGQRLPNAHLHNAYGPTETTVDATGTVIAHSPGILALHARRAIVFACFAGAAVVHLPLCEWLGPHTPTLVWDRYRPHCNRGLAEVLQYDHGLKMLPAQATM